MNRKFDDIREELVGKKTGKYARRELNALAEDNQRYIDKLSHEDDKLSSAIIAKENQLTEYTRANERSTDAFDPNYYRRLSQELDDLKKTQHDVQYHRDKLEENNKQINELIGGK